MQEGPLEEQIRPYVFSLISAAQSGDDRATEVIRLYQMHSACPSDPAAAGLCSAAFHEWLAKRPADARALEDR